MLRALFYFGALALVCSHVAISPSSNERSSIWAVQVHPKSIGRVQYEDGEVILFSSQNKATDIFFTPVLRMSSSSHDCNESIHSGHIELSLFIELHSSQLIAAIRAYLKQRLPTLCSENHMCNVSPLPVHAIRLVQRTNRMQPTRQWYTVKDTRHWNANTLPSIEFHIHTVSKSACEQLLSSIIKQCHLSNFEVHYALPRIRNNAHTVPLRCSSETGTTNHPHRYKRSAYNQQHTKQENEIQRLTKQLSQCEQQRKKYQNPNKCRDRQWKQDATTVAGEKGRGSSLDQLMSPTSISFDSNNNIFIADTINNRIVEWNFQTKNGTIVAGGNKPGTRRDQLFVPKDVIVDKNSGSIIVCDQQNRRVIRWFNHGPINPKIFTDNIGCARLAIGKDGSLYVSDAAKHEVRRWREGDEHGTPVAGGNGIGDGLNQLNEPTFVFVDDQQSVYVSDWNNHRVMKWREGATEGVVVAGGKGYGNRPNQLHHPAGIFVDCQGHIYVVDAGNDRVMRWREGRQNGEVVVGDYGKGNAANQLNSPAGLSFDDEGNLYVVDRGNHRIQKFDLITN